MYVILTASLLYLLFEACHGGGSPNALVAPALAGAPCDVPAPKHQNQWCIRGVQEGAGSGGGGGSGFALTAQHTESCRFPRDSIPNAYLRCYRWRSQRQRVPYKTFWKAPLIFHQNCVYARKQTKKEVCRLNPPWSLSLTQTQTCSLLCFNFSPYCFTLKPNLGFIFPTFCSTPAKANRLNHV